MIPLTLTHTHTHTQERHRPAAVCPVPTTPHPSPRPHSLRRSTPCIAAPGSKGGQSLQSAAKPSRKPGGHCKPGVLLQIEEGRCHDLALGPPLERPQNLHGLKRTLREHAVERPQRHGGYLSSRSIPLPCMHAHARHCPYHSQPTETDILCSRTLNQVGRGDSPGVQCVGNAFYGQKTPPPSVCRCT